MLMKKDELLSDLLQCLAQKNNEKFCSVPRSLILECIHHIDNTDLDETGQFLRLVRQYTTPIQFAIFRELVLAQGGAVPFEHLINATGTTSRPSLWVHVSRLRLKMSQHNWGQIGQLRGIGYVWLHPTLPQSSNSELPPVITGPDDRVEPKRSNNSHQP